MGFLCLNLVDRLIITYRSGILAYNFDIQEAQMFELMFFVGLAGTAVYFIGRAVVDHFDPTRGSVK